MEKYTARDGLDILRYLKLDRLNDSQTKIFTEMWNEIYRHFKNPLLAARILYSKVLPYADDSEYANQTSDSRDREFVDKVKACELEGILKTGGLKEALKFSKRRRFPNS
ncbi:MAG: hypothetical protein ABSG05_01135 [Candidatus Pacearchaeota archaeon]|jgi:hypothetical protein